MAREINLVPDIKDEFIKALKFRNLVFFICIVVASGSLIAILIFISISGGQQGIITAKKNTVDALYQKITDYSDLNDFLTIKDQLGNITAITENKTMASRTFGILSAIIPTGADYINISELSVDLSNENPTFSIEAQANAGTAPFIDYNVLDSFKKSLQYIRYDYGDYIDKNGDTIPAYCIIENNADGSIMRDQTGGYYAYWLIDGEGCNPAVSYEDDSNDEDAEDSTSSNSSSNTGYTSASSTGNELSAAELRKLARIEAGHEGYTIEEYQGQNVVRIWRTPQYQAWYKSNPAENEPYMDLNGEIYNIAHFKSNCITYSGIENDNGTVTWSTSNNECRLVPEDGDDIQGIVIEESSNGRDSDENLVLRFSAIITFAPEVFNFNNHHMLALPPSGRRNVTDSYAQIQSMFAERATDCAQDDAACFTTSTGGESTNDSNASDQGSSSSSNPTENEDTNENDDTVIIMQDEDND